MITIEEVHSLLKDNNLIHDNGLCFYGWVDVANTNLEIINVIIKNAKEQKVIALGVSDADLIVIPYSSLNKQFLLNQKSVFNLSEINRAIVKKSLNKYSLTIALMNSSLITIIFEKRHLENPTFKSNILKFLDKIPSEGKEIIATATKDKGQIDFANLAEANPNIPNQAPGIPVTPGIPTPQEPSTPPASVATPKPSNPPNYQMPKTNKAKDAGGLICQFKATVIPTTLLENPEESNVQKLDPIKATISFYENNLTINSFTLNYNIDKNRISSIIVKRNDDDTLRLRVLSRNDEIFAVLIQYSDMGNSNYKENVLSLINSFIHTGEGIENLVASHKDKKVSNSFATLGWFLLLALIIGAIVWFNIKG